MGEDRIVLIATLWIVIPGTLLDEYKDFGEMFCLHIQGRMKRGETVNLLNLTMMMDTVCSSETVTST